MVNEKVQGHTFNSGIPGYIPSRWLFFVSFTLIQQNDIFSVYYQFSG